MKLSENRVFRRVLNNMIEANGIDSTICSEIIEIIKKYEDR